MRFKKFKETLLRKVSSFDEKMDLMDSREATIINFRTSDEFRQKIDEIQKIIGEILKEKREHIAWIFYLRGQNLLAQKLYKQLLYTLKGAINGKLIRIGKLYGYYRRKYVEEGNRGKEGRSDGVGQTRAGMEREEPTPRSEWDGRDL